MMSPKTKQVDAKIMIRRLSVLVLALPLAGCISFGAKPPPSMIALTSAATVPAGTAGTTSDEKAVAVMIPNVQPSLATQRVMVQDGPNAVAYVPKALWAGAPGLLFRNLLAETIEAKTGRFVPDQRATGLQPNLRLSGQLTQFGIDAPARQAVVIYDAVLAKSGSTTLQTKRFEAHAPVSAVDEANAASGINAAANQVAADVAAWVGAN